MSPDATRALPDSLEAQALAFLRGEVDPAPTRDAATVVLLRPATEASGVEAYLLRRHSAMPFAAGMVAFPGGTVDPRDRDRQVGWAGPTAAEWAERFDCGEGRARALVCAAIRETFEESGVLLAGDDSGSVVAGTTDAAWESDRAALVDRSLAFTEFLNRRGLVARTDLLAYWAHWITPEFEARRYDTRFFVAVMPAGQVARDVSGEADAAAWTTPRDALARVDEGAAQMLPPTRATLAELATVPSPLAAIEQAAHRSIRAVMPRVVWVDGAARLVVDADVGR